MIGRRLSNRFAPCVLAAVGLLAGSGRAWAHLPALASATVTIADDGHYTLRLKFDVAAFTLNQTPAAATDPDMIELLNSPTNVLATRLEQAQARFLEELTVEAGGGRATVETITYPTVNDLHRYEESVDLVQLPVMLELSLAGRLPAGAPWVSFRFPPKLGVLALTVRRPVRAPESLVVNPGETTPPIPLQLGGASPALPSPAPLAEPSRWRMAGRYLRLGFEHILPKGTDHILFVLGLFLLGNRLKPLLLQVTAFTVAHSITLALSLYGVFRLPSAVVEPLIAASITLVAVENLFTSELRPWRPFVVFGFGLLHGLGFAGVLNSFGLPRNAFFLALVTFNAGVELGQLSVITLAFAAVGWWRRRPGYRGAVVVPASLLIAGIGSFWTVQRVALALH